MPSEVVTAQPSREPTGHRQELMLRVSTRSASRAQFGSSRRPPDFHRAAGHRGHLAQDAPVKTSYLETSTAQAPQPPSAQAIFVPCIHVETKVKTQSYDGQTTALTISNNIEYLEISFHLDHRVQILAEVPVHHHFHAIYSEPRLIRARRTPDHDATRQSMPDAHRDVAQKICFSYVW